MENDSKKTLQLFDATSATKLVTSKQIAPQTSNGLRRMRGKVMKKEDPRRCILHGMTMTHPMVRRRRLTFYPRTMRVMITYLKKTKQKEKV